MIAHTLLLITLLVCVTTAAQSFYTIGTGFKGELANGYASPIPYPLEASSKGILATKNVSTVVKSVGNTFVITTDNELYGWGTSANLGLGTTTDAYYPVNIPMTGALAGKTIVKLDGVSQMVMLTQDGAVFGWGPNSNNPTPTRIFNTGVLAGKVITDVAAGLSAVCILTSENKLYTAGSNNAYQLGDGTTATGSSLLATVKMDGVLSGKIIKAVRAAIYTFAVLTQDGLVYTWGYASSGALGNGVTSSNSNVPVKVSVVSQISSIYSMYDGFLALDNTNKLYGWGNNGNNQFNPTNTNANTPVVIDTSAIGTIAKVYSRIGSSVSILGADGSLWMRGINSDLVTGTGLTTLTVTSLTRVVNTAYAGKKILTFDSTERHAGLVTTDGTLYTWGNCQTYYGCGYSVGSSLATPDLSVFNGSNIDSIAVGRSSMIVLSNNTIYTIGDNVNGQSGTGAKSTYGIVTWTPISRTGVLAGLTFKSVFSSDYVSGLITSTGELYMWGSNFLGVLGDGTFTEKLTPTKVISTGVLSGKIITKAVVGASTLAIDTNGVMYSWGDSTTNGDSTATGPRSVPGLVSTNGALLGKTIVEFDTTGSTAIVITSTGTVHTWGSHDGSSLGIGQASGTYSSAQAALAGSLSGKFAVAVSTYGPASAVITSDGNVHVWGSGYTGRGNVNTVPIPVLLTLPNGTLVPKYVSSAYFFDVNSYISYNSIVLTAANSTHTQILGWGTNRQNFLGPFESGDVLSPVVAQTIADPTIIAYAGGTFTALLSDGSYTAPTPSPTPTPTTTVAPTTTTAEPTTTVAPTTTTTAAPTTTSAPTTTVVPTTTTTVTTTTPTTTTNPTYVPTTMSQTTTTDVPTTTVAPATATPTTSIAPATTTAASTTVTPTPTTTATPTTTNTPTTPTTTTTSPTSTAPPTTTTAPTTTVVPTTTTTVTTTTPTAAKPTTTTTAPTTTTSKPSPTVVTVSCYGITSTSTSVCSRRGVCASTNNCVCYAQNVIGKECEIQLDVVSTKYVNMSTTPVNVDVSTAVKSSTGLLSYAMINNSIHISTSVPSGKKSLCWDASQVLQGYQAFLGFNFPTILPSNIDATLVLQPKDGSQSISTSIKFSGSTQTHSIQGVSSTSVTIQTQSIYLLIVSVETGLNKISSQIVDRKNVTLSSISSPISSNDLSSSLSKNAYFMCLTMSSAARSIQADTDMAVPYFGFQKIGTVGTLIDNTDLSITNTVPVAAPASTFGMVFGAVFGSIAGFVFLLVIVIVVTLLIITVIRRKRNKKENKEL